MLTLIDTGKSKLWVYPNYSPDIYPYLRELPLLSEPPIFVAGKLCHQRRDVGFFSDESKGYQYSGTFIPSTPLKDAPIIAEMLTAVNKSLNVTFNGVLVNRYINGEKYLSAHSDEEKALEKSGRRMVAGIAYGTTRTFRIRDKTTKKIVLDHPHQPCSLIVMEGQFQNEFKHEIPVQKRIKEERISLTFRHHLE